MFVKVVIPALNEERAIAQVIAEIPRGLVDEVVVADNLSTDSTAAVAASAGATVVSAAPRGYGTACLAGLAYLEGRPHDIVVFLDGDRSDHPEVMPQLLAPILAGEADMVIGSRSLGEAEHGALLPQQVFGNWLATTLIALLMRHRYTDLGPFRAIRRDALSALEMRDRDFGWTVEMQVKAVQRGLRVVEVPVPYRRRIGKSKIAGTVSGTVRAGVKILGTIGRLWVLDVAGGASARRARAPRSPTGRSR